MYMLQEPMLTLFNNIFCSVRKLPLCLPAPRHLRLDAANRRMRKAYAYIRVTQERRQKLEARLHGRATQVEPDLRFSLSLPDPHACSNVALVTDMGSADSVVSSAAGSWQLDVLE